MALVLDSGCGQAHAICVTPRTPVVPADDCYLPLRALAIYAGVSVKYLYKAIHDPDYPLPHYRQRKLLVKRSDYDRWVQRFRRDTKPAPVRHGRHAARGTRDIVDEVRQHFR